MPSQSLTSAWEATASLLTARNALTLAGSWFAFKVLQALYNISPLHPLSHIPGPKLAAATYWPEFYHDVVRFGRYTGEIRKWHALYGKFATLFVWKPVSHCYACRSDSSHQSARGSLQ